MNDPSGRTLNWTYLLSETYRIYWERFGTFFRIALVPALLVYLLDYIARALMPWLKSLPLDKALLLVTVISVVQGAVYWVVSGFLLAAVASSLVATQNDDSPLLSDAYTHARGRMGTVVAVGLFLWFLFFIGRGMISFSALELLERLHGLDHQWVLTLAIPVLLLMLLGILSRFGLAIPEAIKDQSLSLGQALRNSIKKTEDWELFFMAFLAKSAVAGYAVYWLYGNAIHRLWQHGMLNRAIAPWIDRVFYIGLAAALESPLFIALSILCRDWKPAPEGAHVSPPPIG